MIMTKRNTLAPRQTNESKEKLVDEPEEADA